MDTLTIKWIPFVQSMDYLGTRVNVCSISVGTIFFVGPKRDKYILYPTSSNTQWGVENILY